jgi:hypothetical protein
LNPDALLEHHRETVARVAARGAAVAYGSIRLSNGASDSASRRATGAVATAEEAAAFLVLTGVAKDAEKRLGSVLGPEDAHSAVYAAGSCGRTSEFSSATAR